MSIAGFTTQDFDTMAIPGLEPRMEGLIAHVRPKLEEIGTEIQPFLSALTGDEMFPHVAKHARRTINPPNDTWVAWSSSKRGYKALPHFQVGLFSTHLFIVMAVIYESPNKEIIGRYLEQHASEVQKKLPGDYYWSMDHMTPGGKRNSEITAQELAEMGRKLLKVKKSEILCGLSLPRTSDQLQDGEGLAELIRSTFETLLPLYKISF
ncbi:hypothetical protein AWM70_10830 [Paenibacillus yonginensis]|uniref:UPF0637 protein AWM70_10830 n=1 Tax=Paenibacillus yonginensis TaxID=1462996 RepID=A0A1B1N0S7_9BACL|nr:DUF1054 domain-containing protein [Paenibacillus yonginensis]ANS75037.1 hypothetical protein AWM70_10830 [Paenibacillus yonginensis]